MKASFYDYLKRVTPKRVKRQLENVEKIKRKTVWQEETTFVSFIIFNESLFEKKIAFKQTLEEVQLTYYQLVPTLSSIGRGFTQGKIDSSIPKEITFDCLIPCQKLTVQSGTWQVIICEIKLKPTLKKTLTVEIFPDLFVELTLLKNSIYELDQNEFSVEIWQYPEAIFRFYQLPKKAYFGHQHEQLTKQSLSAYQDIGGNVVMASIVHEPWHHQTYDDCPSLVKWQKIDEQNFTFDFKHLLSYIRWNQQVGIFNKIKCFSLLPWGHRLYYYDKNQQLVYEELIPGTHKWSTIWSQFIRAFIKFLLKHDLEETVYFAIDERPLEEIQHVLNLLSHHLLPSGKRIKLSIAVDVEMIHEPVLLEIEDVSISQMQTMDKETIRTFIKSRKMLGFETSIYNCTGHYPGMFIRSELYEIKYILWYITSLGADGFLRWALDAWPKNPLKDSTHYFFEAGDCFLLYPHDNNVADRVFPSLRWLVLKETLEEIRKFHFRKQPETLKNVASLLSDITLPAYESDSYGILYGKEAESVYRTVKQLEEILNRRGSF